MRKLKLLSIGWGVQSWTLAAMSAVGEIEPIDAAIHAPTFESVKTKDFIKRWSPWLEEHNVTLLVAKNNPKILNSKGTMLPAFTLSRKGKSGKLQRQCTTDWKIIPMRRAISALLEIQGIKKTPGCVEQWIGISIDEFQRMKDSRVKYIKNRYPLVEMKLTRNQCAEWLIAHGLEVPPKSACTFCMFHDTPEWRNTKNNDQDWKEAVGVDELIRNARPPYRLYVHPARIPLAEIDLRTPQEKGQTEFLHWDDECEGICGV